MNDLGPNWHPNFGTIYTWYAMDRNRKISMMTNNNWGNIPRVLLCVKDIEEQLGYINEYVWEESSVYNKYPVEKNGKCILDMYCFWFNKNLSKDDVYKKIMEDYKNRGVYSESNIPINKGFYIYEAIDGYKEGDDYPVGYDGPSKMGDYFRFLQPTIYGSIEDFPKELRGLVAVSKTVDFTVDRLLDNNLINTYFPEVYK